MGKYQELSKQALENLGGVENISHVTHCATRLRIDYKKKSLVNEEGLKDLPESAGIVNKQGQVQIIIGPGVNDAYNEFLTVSGWQPDGAAKKVEEEEEGPHNVTYWLNKFGNFVAPIFMPVVPAMITGGLILAIKNLLVNYFGFSVDSGTAQLMLAIFQAGFTFLPVYIGYTLASQLKMQPIMGAFLGALLICDKFNSGVVTDFFGIGIPQVSYGSTVLPIVLGVAFMFWVDKGLKKIIPEALVFFLKPLLTMAIVAPVTFIILGPAGNQLSGYVGQFVVWLTSALGFIAQPILAVIYPYMVMFGLDKALSPIGIELVATLGYNSVTGVMGFVSNICIGATALAVATTIKNNKGQKGMISSFGVTALCGVTEPAFYGALISRPKALIGTAIGAASAGLVAGIFGLRVFVQGGCPGLLTFLFFVDQNGSLYYVWIAALVAVVAIVVSFVSTKIILAQDQKKAVNKA
ncbi:PTS transporter subunit EIIC [Anaerorhabdus sp.]|uniref:PTS transporter subunit EIIC n=1 Tax=Anaerorhabdus sp. TaxID=1872524 RepID=UPI002FC5BE1C